MCTDRQDACPTGWIKSASSIGKIKGIGDRLQGQEIKCRCGAGFGVIAELRAAGVAEKICMAAAQVLAFARFVHTIRVHRADWEM